MAEVWLNRNTKVSYNYKFRSYRKVELQGEAYFEVAKDTETPFVIETGSGRTTVTGTSFTVSAYPGSKTVEVNVVSGSVNISSTLNDGAVETLTAGDKGVIEQATGKLTKAKTDDVNFRAWQTNELVFDNDSMYVESRPSRLILESMWS